MRKKKIANEIKEELVNSEIENMFEKNDFFDEKGYSKLLNTDDIKVAKAAALIDQFNEEEINGLYFEYGGIVYHYLCDNMICRKFVAKAKEQFLSLEQEYKDIETMIIELDRYTEFIKSNLEVIDDGIRVEIHEDYEIILINWILIIMYLFHYDTSKRVEVNIKYSNKLESNNN